MLINDIAFDLNNNNTSKSNAVKQALIKYHKKIKKILRGHLQRCLKTDTKLTSHG